MPVSRSSLGCPTLLLRTVAPFAFLAVTIAGQGQQPMGTVATADARVTGQVAVRGTEAQLLSNVNVTAFDRTAPVTLGRGGQLLVCSTSEFHLLRSGEGPALIFALDRGAFELHATMQPSDIVITPDVQLTPVTRGQYDLRLRVTREGDTCVENLGANAPVLNAVDPFSSATYRVLPGQHLLFVKGDLHKVVDHERSPCGCPASTQPLVAGAAGASRAAAAYPFPDAVSQGLATPTVPGNNTPEGATGAQLNSTLAYGADQPPPSPSTSGVDLGGSTGAPTLPPPPAPPSGFFHSIGHFFRRIFRSL